MQKIIFVTDEGKKVEAEILYVYKINGVVCYTVKWIDEEENICMQHWITKEEKRLKKKAGNELPADD